MKLGLGTAQLGLVYGISNRTGRIPTDEVRLILSEASASGVQYLDTAFLYGDSEEVLGQTLSVHHSFRIVTKTPQFPAPRIVTHHAEILIDSFKTSLSRMKQCSIYALLVHRAQDLLKPGGEQLQEGLLSLKAAGNVKKIGVSVYSGEEIDRILDCFSIDIIQLPINVLDQRLISSGQLNRLKAQGVEIHARSIFLQGLLLMESDKTPAFFNPIRSILKSYQKEMERNGMTALEGALAFVRQHSEIDVAVVGISSLAEFRQILASWGKTRCSSLDFSQFACTEERFMDPSRWEIAR